MQNSTDANQPDPQYVFSREGDEKGRLTGGSRFCRLESCTGRRLGVRWPDGKLTWPCTKGLVLREDGQYHIL